MIRKILAITLSFTIILWNITISVTASESTPSGNMALTWTTSSRPDGNSGVETVAGGYKLWFDTSESTNTAGNAAITAALDVRSQDEILIDFKINPSGVNEEQVTTVALKNSATKSCEILNFTGGTISSADDTVTVSETLVAGTATQVRAIVRKADEEMTLFIGESTYEIDLSSKWKSFDYSNINLEFKHKTDPAKTSIESDVEITDVIVSNFTNGGSTLKFIPENGTQTVDVAQREVLINCGYHRAPSFYADSNFSFTDKDGNDVSYTKQLDGCNVKLVLNENEAFEELETYTVTIGEVYDAYGNTTDEEKVCSFKIQKAGYENPVATVTVNPESVYFGQNTEITATGTACDGCTIEKLVLYVDDEPVKTVNDSATLTYTLEKGAGTYTVKAVATDDLGTDSEPVIQTVTVLENDYPTVAFSRDLAGENATIEELEALKLVLNDTIGGIDGYADVYLDGIAVYLNGELTEAATSDMLTKGLHTLKAEVSDIYGLKATAETSFVLVNSPEYTLSFEEDFESYELTDDISKITNASMWNLNVQEGDQGKVVLEDTGEEDYGQVASIEVPAGCTDDHRYSLNTRDSTRFVLDFDVNIKNVSTLAVQLWAGSYLKADQHVNFKNGTLSLASQDSSQPTINKSYSQGTWYHITYEVNLESGTYNFALDGVPLVKGYKLNPDLVSYGETEVILTPSFTDAATEKQQVLLDNIVCRAVTEQPVIQNVYAQEGKSSIQASDNKLNVKLTASIDAESLTDGTVTLKRGTEDVLIDNLTYDASNFLISFDIMEPLISCEQYTLTISKTVLTGQKVPLAENLVYSFDCAYKNIDLMNAVLVNNGSGKSVKFKLINNGLASSSQIYLLVSVWDDNRMKEIVAKELTLEVGENDYTSEVINAANGNAVEVMVLDSLSAPVCIASEIFN